MTVVYESRRPRIRQFQAGDNYWPEARETLDVLIEEDAPTDTGLVDQFGVTIYRKHVRDRVGF